LESSFSIEENKRSGKSKKIEKSGKFGERKKVEIAKNVENVEM
jgi:hypothetical protein